LGEFLKGGMPPVSNGDIQIDHTSPAVLVVLRESLNRVGMAWGLQAYDDAIDGLDGISAVGLSSTEQQLTLSVASRNPEKTADAISKLLAVTPGCSVGGLEVEVVHRSNGMREIVGPRMQVRIQGFTGRMRWNVGEVTMVLLRN